MNTKNCFSTPDKLGKNKRRYALLDEIRGFAILNMIAYHALWDLVYLFGVNWNWYRSNGAYVWQQLGCCTFIFLSGFCQPLGQHKLRRGLFLLLCGGIVSLVTTIVMPQSKVLFGILTFMGCGTLLLIPLEQVLERCRPLAGFVGSLVLFVITRNVNRGAFGFYGWNICELPKSWYRNMFTTFLGFPTGDFFSTDYFSLVPWVFLFAAGYFFYWMLEAKHLLYILQRRKTNVLDVIGRHSLMIYMLHQPVIYATLYLVKN